MPQKLTVNDYVFYIVPDEKGKYLWKEQRGNIHRKRVGIFDKLLPHDAIEVLYAIANVEIVQTGEQILVYEIFEDLREE